jgi:predicted ATP-grasp superfamily ATP-dependent carboligase
MNVLILDGHLKSALATVRSLGGKGMRIAVASERTSGMALHSKYASSVFTYPSPLQNQRGFVEAVKREAEKSEEKPVVYAFSDATWLSLFTYRAELRECLVLPEYDEESVRIAFDKSLTATLAATLGIKTIPSQVPNSEDELEVCAQKATYPVVVKTRKSVTWRGNKGIFGTASFAQDNESLIESFSNIKQTVGEAPLIQDFVMGEEYGVEMLAQEGKVYASVSHRRLKSLSPIGGASVLKETLGENDLKSELESVAQSLAEKLDWKGPMMVEFKIDKETNTIYLMEINARFWGSLPLSVAAGVNFPWLYYEDLKHDKRPQNKVVQKRRVITNHFLGSVVHLVRVLFKRDPMRRLVYPPRFQAIKDFLFVPRGTKNDVWMLGDPAPAFWEIVDIVKKLWK